MGFRAVKNRLTVATRKNFENILEYGSRTRTRFKDHFYLQYVRDTLNLMLSISPNKC